MNCCMEKHLKRVRVSILGKKIIIAKGDDNKF